MRISRKKREENEEEKKKSTQGKESEEKREGEAIGKKVLGNIQEQLALPDISAANLVKKTRRKE